MRKHEYKQSWQQATQNLRCTQPASTAALVLQGRRQQQANNQKQPQGSM
jgi:hypothetical protein